jgi:hypothetical protein
MAENSEAQVGTQEDENERVRRERGSARVRSI